MKRKYLFGLLAVLVISLSAFATTIPAGTLVHVRLGASLSSGANRAGQTWDGVLSRDLVVHGKTIAREGDHVEGRITYVKRSGRLKNPGIITLRLTHVADQTVHSSAVSRKGKSHTASNVEKIGGGAAAGALIGGLAGGGKGAAIGAGAGAGAGTGLAVATGKKEAVFPAESTLLFRVLSSSKRR